MAGTWLARRLAVERNELRRPVDRARVWVVAGAVVGVGVGHRVVAVLPDGADESVLGERAVAVRARWAEPDGRVRRGLVSVDREVRRGGRVTIWVSERGRPVPAPLSPSQVRGQTVMAGVAAGAGTLVLVGVPALLARVWLNRRAYAMWDRQWAVLAPRWSGRN